MDTKRLELRFKDDIMSVNEGEPVYLFIPSGDHDRCEVASSTEVRIVI